MQIFYPSHHSWKKPVEDNHIELFSKSLRQKIRSTVDSVDQNAITTVVKLLDEQTLNWFTPMYEERMKQKRNPKLSDVRNTTLLNQNKKKTYYSLSLFESETPLGATIFSVSHEKLSIAYRTFNLDWLHANLPASPSLYAEWAITEYARKHGIRWLTHGRDRNPFGTFSSIGLGIYKLSVGCIPKSSKNYELKSADTASFANDVLVLIAPEAQTRQIKSSYLITKRDNFSRYEQVTKYPEQLKVNVIFRP